MLTNFKKYSIIITVKREEGEPMKKRTKKLIKKILLYIITNILLFGSFAFMFLYGLSISPTVIK